MYRKFYNLNAKPFQLVPNPAFLFQSSEHARALVKLEYGVREKVGFMMLTGEVGTGKTTLVRNLLNLLEKDPSMVVGVIFNTNVVGGEFIQMLLREYDVEEPHFEGNKPKALERFYLYLIEQFAANKTVLLVIDEAQNLSDKVLEELRMLSNLQTDEDLLLQILIVGQPELREKIQHYRLRQFAQRIAVSAHLGTMTLGDTTSYISHRMRAAGGDPAIFTNQAKETIFSVSKGFPRTINLICHACLVYGYADSLSTIGSKTVWNVIEGDDAIGIITDTTALPTAPPVHKQKTAEQLQAKSNMPRQINPQEIKPNQAEETAGEFINPDIPENQNQEKAEPLPDKTREKGSSFLRKFFVFTLVLFCLCGFIYVIECYQKWSGQGEKNNSVVRMTVPDREGQR